MGPPLRLGGNLVRAPLKQPKRRGCVHDVAAEKARMRDAMRDALAALAPARRALEEEAVQGAIQADARWSKAGTVLLYHARPPEFSVVGLTLAAWRDGKRTLFPRVVASRQLELLEVRTWTELRPGAFGIREPANGPVVEPELADVAIIPGLAFDAAGHRLGRGGGYYDAIVPSMAASWGVGFDCQFVEKVPWEAHDATVRDVWTCRAKRLLDH